MVMGLTSLKIGASETAVMKIKDPRLNHTDERTTVPRKKISMITIRPKYILLNLRAVLLYYKNNQCVFNLRVVCPFVRLKNTLILLVN